MKPLDKLPFTLHPFRRITWVNESLKTEWEPRLEKMQHHAEEVFSTAAAEGLLPVYVNNVRSCETYGYKKKMYSMGLHAEQLSAMPVFIQKALAVNPQTGSNFIISGRRREVISFIENIHNISTLEEITALPPGTLTRWKRLVNTGLDDIHWLYLNEKGRAPQPEKNFQNNMLNPCWRTFGIAAIPHCPVSMHCGKSLALAAQLRSLAEDILSPFDYTTLYEVLSWPAEWSALHGIAELKTPLFKMAGNTTATASKYTIQYLSERYPVHGVRGRMFPYKAPVKLHMSASEKFRRGLIYINRSVGKEQGESCKSLPVAMPATL
ncbi:MAG: hypothetical protein JNM88_17620 [Chitinophagaceae bacterium]|nr:hypothetical protein [Chitinophagaceae bacterium]